MEPEECLIARLQIAHFVRLYENLGHFEVAAENSYETECPYYRVLAEIFQQEC